MVRGGKKEAEKNAAAANPEAEERKRRKRVAFSKGILSEAPAKASTAALLSPSKTGQMKLFGTIVYPKNRYLTLQFSRGGKNVTCEDYFDTMVSVFFLYHTNVSFPKVCPSSICGLLSNVDQSSLEHNNSGPLDLCLDSNTFRITDSAFMLSVLILDFCQQMFSFVSASFRLYFLKHGGLEEKRRIQKKLVLSYQGSCLRLAHDEGYDFKGGAGAPSETKQGVKKAGLKYAEQESPKTDLEDDFSDSQNNFEDFTEVTPVRHSERTAGKRFKYLPCLLFLIDSTIAI
ncbi:hypothetical protein C3L33_01054, partial [Rhododendron williamsianum]